MNDGQIVELYWARSENAIAETANKYSKYYHFIEVLPNNIRKIFMLRYWYLCSIKEIAEDFGFSESKVKMILLRARNELKQTLEKEGVTFDPAIELPNNPSFTHYSSYEEMQKVGEYLKQAYGDFIDMAKPQINICGGDYNIYLQQGYQVEFFDASGDQTKQIINYNFNRVTFYCDDDGKLFLARVYQPDLSEKVGDYPIINTAEATRLLLNGNYITSVPYEMPGEDYIARVELVYRTGEREAYYMPYYRFYVELPGEASDGGMKTYGAYYVPAVESKYISNMPVWNGSFNRLVVNEVDSIVCVDMDVEYTSLDKLPYDVWQTTLKEFQKLMGISYEDFVAKIPNTWECSNFYSLSIPNYKDNDIKDGYHLHDYVFNYKTLSGEGEATIAIC